MLCVMNFPLSNIIISDYKNFIQNFIISQYYLWQLGIINN